MAQDQYEERERADGQKVKILIPTYAKGSDQDRYQWRTNIASVNVGSDTDPVKRYLVNAERYFYQRPADWFGSEKRKNPA
jgi:hypothetical protein